jgi:hypothetical protein
MELIKDKDILESNADFIIHQCNCVSRQKGGLSAKIFSKFPDSASVYGKHTNIQGGTITIHGSIVNLYCQYFVGNPRPKGYDSLEQRQGWFGQCLLHLSLYLSKSGKEDFVVAIPHCIGTDEENWNNYLRIIQGFSQSINGKVHIYWNSPKKKSNYINESEYCDNDS